MVNVDEAKENELQKEKSNNDRKQSTRKLQCIYFRDEHELDTDRQGKIGLCTKKKYLCRSCLKQDVMRNCRKRKSYAMCDRYPTCLHDVILEKVKEKKGNDKSKESKKPTTEDKSISNRIRVTKSMISDTHSMIVPVGLYKNTDIAKKVLVYALVDDQSDACFVKDITQETFQVTVMGESNVLCTKVNGLVVQGMYEQKEITLPHVYSRESLSARQDQIPRLEIAQSWPFLQKIADKLMPYDSDVEVGFIMGLSCTKKILLL